MTSFYDVLFGAGLALIGMDLASALFLLGACAAMVLAAPLFIAIKSLPATLPIAPSKIEIARELTLQGDGSRAAPSEKRFR